MHESAGGVSWRHAHISSLASAASRHSENARARVTAAEDDHRRRLWGILESCGPGLWCDDQSGPPAVLLRLLFSRGTESLRRVSAVGLRPELEQRGQPSEQR